MLGNRLIELIYAEKYSADKRYFEDKIAECFIDKVRAGIDIPNYPQFRDMNEMFLDAFEGIKKTDDGYIITESTSIDSKRLQIPEIKVLEEKTREIYEKINAPLRIKLCATGPYTLSSPFIRKDSNIFSKLGEVISQIIEANIFDNKYGKIELVTLDEPVFGLFDDPLLDYGSSGREGLLKAWELIFRTIKLKNIKTCIHLHGSTNDLFWQINSLDIIESHVKDPLYSDKNTKQRLEKEDKFLKASIGITNFDSLINNHLRNNIEIKDETSLNQRTAELWTDIQRGKIDPTIFLEKEETMMRRLKEIIKRFGEERVLYAGPECGLKSYPTYECAIEYLKRIANAVRGSIS